MFDVVNLTMTGKHVKTKLHGPVVMGNTLRTRESAQGGKWKKRVQQVKVENYLCLTEARTNVEASRPAATGKTYAAMVKFSTTRVAIQTDLTRYNSEEKKKADIIIFIFLNK